MNKFVVIGGAPRSGTNLVRRIVGSNSEIAIPPGEFQLFSQVAKGKTVADVLKNPRLEKWGVDLAPYQATEPGTAYVEILKQYGASIGKSIPGEKTPFNEFYYAELLQALSGYDFRFIHMIRNPFDVMASYKHMKVMKGKSALNDIRDHLRNWVDSVTLGVHRSRENPDQYTCIRYEDLLNNPSAITQFLCDFIGVEFEKERMLNMVDFASHADNTSFPTDEAEKNTDAALIKPHTSRKSHLSSSEIRLVSTVCGPKAIEAGYTDPDFKLKQDNSQRIRKWLSRRMGR